MFQVILHYANKACGVITLVAGGIFCLAVASVLAYSGLILIFDTPPLWRLGEILGGTILLAVVVFLASLGVGAFCDQLSVDHEED